MIIVKLMGGLGNQMFQYAMGRALSLRTNTELKLNLSWFAMRGSGDVSRPYDLSNFNIVENAATAEELKKFKGYEHGVARRVRAFLSRFAPLSWQSHIQEKYFHFDPAILTITHDAYLSGYWQSEQYFSDFAETLRKDFTFRKPLAGENERLADDILKHEAVSIHIRRGDYVSDAKNLNFYESCSLEYYYQGLAEISQRYPDLHVYVFSDDIEWAKHNLNISQPITFISHNHGENAFEDMRLMSLCKHNIIANSTFSWWAAWLNQSPDKIVIAPKRWFVQSRSTDDLIPITWFKL